MDCLAELAHGSDVGRVRPGGRATGAGRGRVADEEVGTAVARLVTASLAGEVLAADWDLRWRCAPQPPLH